MPPTFDSPNYLSRYRFTVEVKFPPWPGPAEEIEFACSAANVDHGYGESEVVLRLERARVVGKSFVQDFGERYVGDVTVTLFHLNLGSFKEPRPVARYVAHFVGLKHFPIALDARENGPCLEGVDLALTEQHWYEIGEDGEIAGGFSIASPRRHPGITIHK